MSQQIPLHPTRALDPHMTYCPHCGGEGSGITIGHMRKARTKHGWVYAIRGQTLRLAQRLVAQGVINNQYDLKWMDTREGEKIPDTQPCNKCKKEIEEHAAIVRAGGVYFRCSNCNATGVINATSEFAKAVRETHHHTNGEPCGVEFSKKDCPVCGPGGQGEIPEEQA